MTDHYDSGDPGRGGCERCADDLVFPEVEYRTAAAEYAAGDLAHAAVHIGFALCAEPDRPEWLALLDRLVDEAPDPLALVPFQDGEGSFLDAALRGHVLHRLGRIDEALDLLFAAAEARPDIPFLVWAPGWVSTPAAAASVDIDLVSSFLAERLRRHPEEPVADEEGIEELSDALPLARALFDAGRREPLFVFLTAAINRKLGRAAEALRVAEEAYGAAPCYLTALALAYAHESLGREERAQEFFARALELEPDRAPVGLTADLHDAAG